MVKDFDLLVSNIEIYIINNPGKTLHIYISTDFYRSIINKNRFSLNLNYDPPKLLGHSFSIKDDINTLNHPFLITSEMEAVGAI